GYDTFIAERFAHYYEKTPEAIKRLIEKIVGNLPTSFSNISLDFKAKRFISGFRVDKKYRHHTWLGAFDKANRAQLFLPILWEEIKIIDNYLEKSKTQDYKKQLILLYLRTYLMDDILVKVDRASMFNSLEVRTPMLDYRFVDFANSLPSKYKLQGKHTKYILKKLMRGKLPKGIIERKKKGFGIPIADWLTEDLKPLALDLLSPEKIKNQGLFDYKFINNLLTNHFSRKEDNRKTLWTLLVFQMWQEKWLKN
ncbi:asparagine synthase-related protein, partial [Patescibacteria group bacterium]